MADVEMICSHCRETLHECPLCSGHYHRLNVLLSESAVMNCLLCMPLARRHANDPDELLRWYRRNRQQGMAAVYDPMRERRCA